MKCLLVASLLCAACGTGDPRLDRERAVDGERGSDRVDAAVYDDAAVPNDADAGERPEEPVGTIPTTHPDEGPSCAGVPDHCGLDANESCCTTLFVPGGSFLRSYDGVVFTDPSYPATVSDFLLDKYEVTTERFRKFATAWQAGWRPAEGAGRHTHLNGGQGLVNGPDFELGWQSEWTALVSAEPSKAEPLRPAQHNWYDAYAFCIWDGGFLPSEAEWNYAAVGGDEQRVYPWSQPPSSTDIDPRVHLVACYGINGLPSDTCTTSLPVGSRPAGNGPWDHTDLIGNENEWVLDGLTPGEEEAYLQGTSSTRIRFPYEVPCTDCLYAPAAVSYRAIKGGSHVHSLGDPFYPSQRAFRDSVQHPGGVRCARSPAGTGSDAGAGATRVDAAVQ